jgi:hypothetical protein
MRMRGQGTDHHLYQRDPETLGACRRCRLPWRNWRHDTAEALAEAERRGALDTHRARFEPSDLLDRHDTDEVRANVS